MAAQNLSEYLASFQTYLDTGTDLAVLTKQRYIYEVTQFIKQTKDPVLEEVTSVALLEWHASFQQAGLAHQTVNQRRAAVKKFLDFLEEIHGSEHAGRLLRSLARLKAPRDAKPRREPHALSDLDYLRLRARAALHVITGSRDLALVDFLWATGCRRAEVANLLLDDLDLEERMAIVIGKGSRERTVAFDEPCQGSLRGWLEDREEHWPVGTGADRVFINMNGGALKPEGVGSVIRTCAMEAGLKGQVYTHLFRHRSVTRMLDQGMALQNVAVIHGHKQVSTTMGYFHESPERLRDEYDRLSKPKEASK